MSDEIDDRDDSHPNCLNPKLDGPMSAGDWIALVVFILLVGGLSLYVLIGGVT